MAKHEITVLYNELVKSEFGFLKNNTHHIDDIYIEVKTNYINLCDDGYFCSTNCSRGHNQPEWKHAVRRALERLKSKNSRVCKGEKNHWIFK